ncbi:MAG: HAMP domain-containing histidine kinase [Lachnospiraceae bacterium]|nr:HAMP domain-containing histidine kinase [Lachnospiraceae bacterium]
MIKKNFFGIFGKVFLYTVLILFFVIGGIFLFFSNQIQSTITLTQQQQLSNTFTLFREQIQGKTTDEIIAIAEDFHRWNASFEFCLISKKDEILFQTDGFGSHVGIIETPNGIVRYESNPNETNNLSSQVIMSAQQTMFTIGLENEVRLIVSGSFSESSMYTEILQRAVWVFGLITLISLLAAFFFARQIAKPIQKISADAQKMSLLLPVDPPKKRGDEIGQLSKNVYAMYGRLKSTIQQLETEINRVKLMQENQRYFFSAASHELKTPITAIGGIFEGMLSEVITREEYPSYLREGIKIVKEQNKLVSEILELVKLGGELPSCEKEPLNLRRCLDSVLEQLSPLIESKEQSLTVDIADNISCELNSRLFSKALSNVLLNAAQNSPDGAEICIAAKEKPRLVCLTVWNGSAEIPERIISKIYEPFYRADEARTTSEGRSGLGLTIVKKTLDLMGAAFEIANVDGGVMFTLNIPIE